MANAIANAVDRAVAEWVTRVRKKIPARIRRLMAMAAFDLWYGPLPHGYSEATGYGVKGNTRWPGFISACKQIRQTLERIKEIDEIWVDLNSEDVMTREPQGFYDGEEIDENWVEPNWEDIVHLEHREMMMHLMDKELVPHVM